MGVSALPPDIRPTLVAALGLAALSAATLATVWTLDRMGYTPCELCLTEREPFYIAVPLALTVAAAAATGRPRVARLGLAALALLFAVGAALGVYHAGVEWSWWPGPSGCSGAMAPAAGVADFLKQLNTVKVVRCDAAALRVMGLSLAGWNALLCVLLAAVALAGLRAAQPGRTRNSSSERTVPPSTTAA